MNELLSITEIAAMLNTSEGKITTEIAAGSFPSPMSIGGKKVWTRRRINQHIEAAERAAEQQTLSNRGSSMAAVKIPVKSRLHKPLKAYDNPEQAYIAGLVFRAALFNDANAASCLRGYGINASMTGNTNSAGGFLVPDEVESALSVLRERHSTFARRANPFPMNSDICRVPRLLADVSTQWATEGQEATASDLSLGGMQMKAKKLVSLSKVSSEVDEDAVIDLGDVVTYSMGLSQAAKIDTAGFNGDGTSTYGHNTGLKGSLHSSAIYTAATGNVSAATLDLADFEGTAALLPSYETAEPRWYMHPSVFFAAASRVLSGQFYTVVDDDGVTRPVLLGYPVEFVPSMPTSTAATVSTIVAYFGDLRLGCTLGTRNGARTAISTGRYFEHDQIGIRQTQRVSIVCHEDGADTATRPIVALKLAAS